jgi:hypothetical protein
MLVLEKKIASLDARLASVEAWLELPIPKE